MACACASAAHAQFNPVTLTPGSYTEAIVVPASTVQCLPYCINVDAGSGPHLSDSTFTEQGIFGRYGQTNGNIGIPIHNTTFTDINNPNITFLMPPDYTVNNEVDIDSVYTSGTITFNNPTTATESRPTEGDL